MAKMSSSANQPVAVGRMRSIASRRAYSQASPAEPSRYFSDPAARNSTPSARTSSGTEPALWYASRSTIAPRSCASRTIGSTSSIAPFR